MNTNQILIGTGIIPVLGTIGYALYKKQTEANEAEALAKEQAEDTAQAQAITAAASSAKNELLAQFQAKEASPVLSKYPIGTLLRVGSNSSIYMINSLGQRQWISSRTTFDKMLLNMEDVKSITQDAMNKIPLGTALAGLGALRLPFGRN